MRKPHRNIWTHRIKYSEVTDMEGKIIAVWGSPHSGKTTFATKLATAIYSSFESTVITLYTDLETPVIPVPRPRWNRAISSTTL